MHFRKLLQRILIGNILAVVPATATSDLKEDTCNGFYKIYPDATFFPGSNRYAYEVTYSWSASAWEGPECVFAPNTTAMVAAAVEVLSARSVPFAVRGGGAMPLINGSSIGGQGILLSTINFTSISISDDKSILTVGAGLRWPHVYSFLEPYGVVVNGGRIGDVGVMGWLLGGGIGFLSYEYGLGSAGVQSFECILANATLVTASLEQNPDLFWALRGGGNSFCVVTSVNLYTIPVATVNLGAVGFGSGPEVQSQYISSLVSFAKYADPQAAVEASIRWNPLRDSTPTFNAFVFNSGEGDDLAGLQNFTAPVLPFVSGNVTRQTLKAWASTFAAASDYGNRKRFRFLAIPADERALEIAVDMYFEAMKSLASVRGFFTAFTVMPITDKLANATAANGGSPLGFDGNSGSSLWISQSPSWKDSTDDVTVMDVHTKVNEDIATKLAEEGKNQLPFIYLNNAETGQKVFEGYGLSNMQRLKEIRVKYDPDLVYTNLMSGGWKVEHSGE